MVTGEGVPLEYHIWQLAERMGWTLDVIDALPLHRWHEYLQIEDGRAAARGSLLNK